MIFEDYKRWMIMMDEKRIIQWLNAHSGHFVANLTVFF